MVTIYRKATLRFKMTSILLTQYNTGLVPVLNDHPKQGLEYASYLALKVEAEIVLA